MIGLKSIIVKYFTSKKFALWIIFFIILLILATLYAYNYMVLPNQKNKDFKNLPNTAAGSSNEFNNGKSIIIRFFTVDWCPYCKKADPEWSMFAPNYDGSVRNGYTIRCIRTDCTKDKDPEVQSIVKKFGIQGYPTVKMEKDGKVIDFDAKVTNEHLTQFVQNMV
jgi:thiol-disulfide isomerase/thioredoxin